MAKIWVLDTETKGTGAHVVPLEKVLRRPQPVPTVGSRGSRRRARRRRAIAAPRREPRRPRRFRVMDVTTREVLTDGADARATLDVLGEVRSVVDVSVYVWQRKAQRWRLLSFGEQKLMWDAARSATAKGSEYRSLALERQT